MMLKTCISERHTKTSKIFINNSFVYVFTESSDEYGLLRFGALLHVLGSEGHTAGRRSTKDGLRLRTINGLSCSEAWDTYFTSPRNPTAINLYLLLHNSVKYSSCRCTTLSKISLWICIINFQTAAWTVTCPNGVVLSDKILRNAVTALSSAEHDERIERPNVILKKNEFVFLWL